MKTFVSKPSHLIAVQYVAADSAMHTDLIALAGDTRVAWKNDGVVAVLCDDTGDWLDVHEGQWIAMCTEGCLHVFEDAEITDLFEEVTP